MSNIYLTIADGFEQLAASFRVLAIEPASVGQVIELKVATEEKQEPNNYRRSSCRISGKEPRRKNTRSESTIDEI
jgi:DNA-binding transcriptional regulator YdaS (Cro superfamily)